MRVEVINMLSPSSVLRNSTTPDYFIVSETIQELLLLLKRACHDFREKGSKKVLRVAFRRFQFTYSLLIMN